MWILPKNLHTSAFVPDMTALDVELKELSEMCGRSLMWRSKPSPVKIWSQRWKKENSLPHLSGRILKPSRGNDFEERWTSSLGGSPASQKATLCRQSEGLCLSRKSPPKTEYLPTKEDIKEFCLRCESTAQALLKLQDTDLIQSSVPLSILFTPEEGTGDRGREPLSLLNGQKHLNCQGILFYVKPALFLESIALILRTGCGLPEGTLQTDTLLGEKTDQKDLEELFFLWETIRQGKSSDELNECSEQPLEAKSVQPLGFTSSETSTSNKCNSSESSQTKKEYPDGCSESKKDSSRLLLTGIYQGMETAKTTGVGELLRFLNNLLTGLLIYGDVQGTLSQELEDRKQKTPLLSKAEQSIKEITMSLTLHREIKSLLLTVYVDGKCYETSMPVKGVVQYIISRSRTTTATLSTDVSSTTVSLFQQQASEPETRTSDTCSPTSSKALDSASLQSSSSKTWKESFPHGLWVQDGEIQPEPLFCSMSLESWKEWVIEQRQEYSARLKSEHLTNGSESSSWPTAKALDWKDTLGCNLDATNPDGSHRNRRDRLVGAIAAEIDGLPAPDKSSSTGSLLESSENWATPNTLDYIATRTPEGVLHQATGARKGRTRPANLREQIDPVTCQIYNEAKSRPTSRTSDAEGGRIKTEETEDGFRSERAKSDQWFGAKLRDAVEYDKPKSAKLNPRWVETLMGLPIGWVKPSDEASNRTDELRLLGNGVVPQTAEKAFEVLINRM